MAFTFTINGNEYTSDPNNVTADAARRFIGYGYLTAIANLATDMVAVAAAMVTLQGTVSDLKDDAEDARDAAVVAKNAAETALDNMDDRYLGSKAADPALDNDGNTLTSGAFYFNTTSKSVKFYDLATATWYAPPTTSAGLVAKGGDTMTGHLNVPAGAAGDQVPRASETMLTAGGSMSGGLNTAKGADIASVATLSGVWTPAQGNVMTVTGTTATTNFGQAPVAGASRSLIAAGAWPLTNGANMLLPGAANYTCTAGDIVTITALSTANPSPVRVAITKADGTPVVAPVTTPLFGAVGASQVIASAASNSFISLCQMTSTRALCLHHNAGGQPKVALVDQTGALVAGHTPVLLDASDATGTRAQIVKLDASTAIAVWSVSGACHVAAMSFSGSTITAGSVVNAGSAIILGVAICALTATKAIVAFNDGTSTLTRACTVTVSGVTCTANTLYTVDPSYGTGNLRLTAISATQAVLTNPAAAAVRSYVITEASNVLTFPASPTIATYHGGANEVAVGDICTVSAARVAWAGGISIQNSGQGKAFTLDPSGTGSSAVFQGGRQINIATGNVGIGHRLRQLSTNTLLHLSSIEGNAGLFLEALYLDGAPTVRQGPAANISYAVATNAFDLCVMDSTTILIAWANPPNSNYPTIRPLATGTVA